MLGNSRGTGSAHYSYIVGWCSLGGLINYGVRRLVCTIEPNSTYRFRRNSQWEISLQKWNNQLQLSTGLIDTYRRNGKCWRTKERRSSIEGRRIKGLVGDLLSEYIISWNYVHITLLTYWIISGFFPLCFCWRSNKYVDVTLSYLHCNKHTRATITLYTYVHMECYG